jgi:putative oxidoreductase
MSFSEMISPLVGRLALSWFFLSEAYWRGADWDGQVALMQFMNLPAPPFLLAVAIVVMGLGGLSILLGFHARHGAMLLFGFVVVATMLGHEYWHMKTVAERAADYEIFERNVAIAGGLLMLIGLGAGPFALDNTGQKKGRR